LTSTSTGLPDRRDPPCRGGTVGQVEHRGLDACLRGLGKLGGGQIAAEDVRTQRRKSLGDTPPEPMSRAAHHNRLTIEPDPHRGLPQGIGR
jgi:hypothetical protein